LAQKRTEAMATTKQPAETFVPDTKTGAAATLQRLEASEAAASDAYKTALESGDAVMIRSTRDNWLEVVESLRKYDAQIADTRRITDEFIERKEMVRILEAISSWWLIGISLCADKVPNLPERTILRDALADTWASAIAMGKNSGGGVDVPEWAVKALCSHHLLADMEGGVKELAETFKA